MLKNEQVTITWDEANTQIIVATNDGDDNNELYITSVDPVVYCNSGFISVTETDGVLNEMKRLHVKQHFDTDINGRILNLPIAGKNKLFQMLHDYADVLSFIFPRHGFPIVEHILGKPWDAATNNPHPGIDRDYNCEIIAQYEEWKNSSLGPKD